MIDGAGDVADAGKESFQPVEPGYKNVLRARMLLLWVPLTICAFVNAFLPAILSASFVFLPESPHLPSKPWQRDRRRHRVFQRLECWDTTRFER